MLPASPRLRRVAPENLRAPGQAEGFHIGADEPPALGRFFDEHAEGRAARHRLQPKRAGAGKQIEDARTRKPFGKPMRQHVENRLARAVGGRAYVLRTRRRQRPAAELAANNAHRVYCPCAACRKLRRPIAALSAITAARHAACRRALPPPGLPNAGLRARLASAAAFSAVGPARAYRPRAGRHPDIGLAAAGRLDRALLAFAGFLAAGPCQARLAIADRLGEPRSGLAIARLTVRTATPPAWSRAGRTSLRAYALARAPRSS